MQIQPVMNETHDLQEVLFEDKRERFELLKKFNFSGKKVELLCHPYQGVVAKVTSGQIETLVLGHDIIGIPNELRYDSIALRRFIKNAYLVLNPIQEGRTQLFAIYVNPSLKGGGSGSSKTKTAKEVPTEGPQDLEKARSACQEAKDQEKGNFYEEAIRGYENAIKTIEESKKQGKHKGVELNDLNSLLRDSLFSLAMMEKKVAMMEKTSTKWEDALGHFKRAQKLGQATAEGEIIAIYLEMADIAKESGNISKQIKYLSEAKKLRSPEAILALASIEKNIEKENHTLAEKIEKLVPKDQQELPRRTMKTLWVPGYQLGKGVTLEGQPTSKVFKSDSLKCRDVEMTGVDQLFTDFVANSHDVARIINLQIGVSATQSLWHLKAIAEYVQSLRVDDTCVHCIIASYYLSSSQQVFSEGELSDPCLRYLQREGFSKFRQQYGTHFVGGSLKGALFLGCVTLNVNRSEIFELRASLKGEISGLIEADSSVEKEIKTTIEQKLHKIDIKTVGIKNLDRVQSLEELQQRYKEFRKIIQDPKNLNPVEAICEPWFSLEEVNKCLVQKPETISLSGVLQHYRERVLNDSNTQSLSQLYTPLKGVASIGEMSAEEKGVDLYDKFEEFMKSNKKVLVLLGEAGSGKSYFLQFIEKKFLEAFDPSMEYDSWIPIRIELGTLSNPVTNAIPEHLSRQGYTESQIQELKQKEKVLIFLDGYDEGRYEGKELSQNLFLTNKLGEWNGKVIISGRLMANEALNPQRKDHLNRFSPVEQEHIRKDQVEEVLICPFFQSQVLQYVNKFVQHADEDLIEKYPDWFKHDCLKFQEALVRIPGLASLATTPFILHSVIEVLPTILAKRQNDLTSKVAKVEIYRCFTENGFEREEVKLLKRGQARPSEFEGKNLVKAADMFCRQIAAKLFEKGTTSLVFIEEDPEIKKDEWDLYFGDDLEMQFLRNICSDIIRKNSVFVKEKYRDQYLFSHLELRDYFLGPSPFNDDDKDNL